MKKLLMVALQVLSPIILLGDSFLVDDLQYTFEEGYNYRVYVSGLRNQYVTEITIPTTVVYEYMEYVGDRYKERRRTCTVTRICLSNCASLKSATIMNGFTNIGDSAFYNCRALESVTIPNSVKSIGDNAFGNCYSLASVAIPGSVTSIGDYAFFRCSDLASVTIPEGVKGIGDYAFYNCSSLASVTIPNSVTSIGLWAFTGSWSVDLYDTSTVPGVKLVDRWAVDLVDTTTPVSGVLDLTRVRGVAEELFRNCTEITNVNIGNDLRSIPSKSFYGCNGLACITIGNSVTNIGSEAFLGCNSLTNVTMLGDCPFVSGDSAFYGVSSSCTAWLPYDNTTYDVVDGKWNGMNVSYHGQPPTVAAPIVSPAEGATFSGDSCEVLIACATDGATIYYTTNGVTPRTSAAFAYTGPIVIYGSANIVAIAVKDGIKSEYTRVSIGQIAPAEPVIVPADGTEFRSETCEVAITCETEGAEIYYTLDGSEPQKEIAIRYTVPFTIADTATIKAVAIGGPLSSETVTATITKRSLSLAESAGAMDLTFTTDETAPWQPIVDASSATGFAAQSGTIGMGASSWMETTVRGKGTLAFKWRVECEEDDSGQATWDRLMVFTNGFEVARIDGIKGWSSYVLLTFGDSGDHAVRWEFIKDDYDEEASALADHGWISGVTWMPDDSLPEVSNDAEAASAIAECVDSGNLSKHVSSAEDYTAFRSWVDNNSLSHAVVRDAPNAWLSYALDAPGLMARAASLANEDVIIESIEPSSAAAGALELVVNIADAEIGEGVTSARLAEALGVEGATELNESLFTSEGLSVTLERTTDGKAKATVAPDGTPPVFFMRVKMK